MKIATTGGKLKTLLTQRSNLLFNLRHAKNRKEKDIARRELGHVNNCISKLRSQPVVTEHAILRYLERVHGVNIRAIEQEIINSETLKMVNDFGYGPAKIPHSSKKCRLVVSDKTVITIEV